MEKAEDEVPRKATQTAVVETATEKQIMTGVAEETTESCDDNTSTSEMEKTEAEEPKEATLTAVVMIAAQKSQFAKGCTKLKIIGPGLLKTGLMVVLLLLIMTNPTLIRKRNATLLKTRSVTINPMMRISGLVQMGTAGDDNEPHDFEDEVGHTEEKPNKTITLLTVEETNTSVVPIKNYVVMNRCDDMKQFKSRKTVGLARQMLLY